MRPNFMNNSGAMLVNKSELKGTEKIASKMLECRLCIMFCFPAGAVLLILGGIFATDFASNRDLAALYNSMFTLSLALVVSGAGMRFGKEGVSLHVSGRGLYVRRLKYGFIKERVTKLIHGNLVTSEDEHGITLHLQEPDGSLTRIEAGISEKRYKEMTDKINAALSQ